MKSSGIVPLQNNIWTHCMYKGKKLNFMGNKEY